MSGTLALASALAEMDRDTLAALVRSRRPHAPAGITDPIGLASDLLKTESIARALAPLDRASLAAVRDPTGADAALVSELSGMGLLGRDGGSAVSLPEVAAALSDALDAAHVVIDSLSSDPFPGDISSDVDTSAWFTSALTAVGQAAECLRTLRDRPGKLNRSGSIAVATVKQLAESTGVEPDEVSLALAALMRAGLVTALTDDHLLITAAASSAWLHSSHVERWLSLAHAAGCSMPSTLRTEWNRADQAEIDLRALAAGVPTRYPLLPATDLTAVDDFVRGAEYLGLTVEGRFTKVADALLVGEVVTSDIARAMPETATGVYVQPDLSVVVPGPLPPKDEAVLAALARPEHIGVASTRRISEASIAEAYERGLSPATAREAFTRISLTGIPQPLEYLLDSLGERVGGIVVGEYAGDEGRTRLSFARADVAATISVDRALQHLQLQRSRASDTVLYSRLSADHVLAALADARYHASSQMAALRDAEPAEPAEPAEVGALQAGATASEAAGATTSRRAGAGEGPTAPFDALVERVFTAARSEPGTGDFTRRLELAIRDRSPVRVTAEARGEVRTFTLLPVSVNAGRLRAADQAAGVERTLPVNMITAVEPA